MDAILQVHKNDPCASMFVTHLLKRIQAPFFFIEARPSAVGLMEARGIAGFGRGNAWTSWISWNRVKTTERFPDVMAGRGRRGEQESIPLQTTHLPLHHLLSDPNLLRPEDGAVMDRLQVVKGR